MRHHNPSIQQQMIDLFESAIIFIDQTTDEAIIQAIDLIFHDLAVDIEAAAYAIRFSDSMFDHYHLDVWGNAEDGYEINNQFIVGHVFLPEMPNPNLQNMFMNHRMHELINQEGYNGPGVHWTNDGDIIEFFNEDGMPLFNLMAHYFHSDVIYRLRHSGDDEIDRLFKDRQPPRPLYDIADVIDLQLLLNQFRKLAAQLYENDEDRSGHDLIRFRLFTNRISITASYKVSMMHAEPGKTEWYSASSSPPEAENIGSWVHAFELMCSDVRVAIDDGEIIPNESFQTVESHLRRFIR